MNKKSLALFFVIALLMPILTIGMSVKASPISISFDPTIGPVGTEVIVEGRADKPDSKVEIFWDFPGNVLETTTAVDYYYSVIIRIPEAVAGTHSIGAKDLSTLTTAAKDFTVESSIDLSPEDGRIGTEVTVSGTGFATVSSINVAWDDENVLTTYSNEYGSFTGSFTVPPSVAGDHNVTATDGDGNTASAIFTVWSITISILPNSGPVGTTVAISGTYATPEESVTIRWDDVEVDTVAAETDGTYSYDLNVPPSTAGAHNITAEDIESTNSATEVFIVEPQIILSLDRGPVTTEVTVTGTGFAGNSYVDITYNEDLVVDDFETSATGDFEATFSVPASVAGDHTVTATDTMDPTITASATFAIVPQIAISPTLGTVGTSVTVTGSGFAKASTVDVYFDRDADGVIEWEDLVLDDVPTDDFGSFAESFFVPESVYGSHSVMAIDVAENNASATFSTEALININPEDGFVGKLVYIEGTGFTGASEVDVYFGEELVLEGVSTDAYGSFDSTFAVPWVATAGNYLVTAIDAEGVTDDATFTVLFVMYTRSNEYFQGDYPSFFIQAVDEEGEPLEGAWLTIEIRDPNGYLQYKAVTFTVEDGTVPYDMQFFSWAVWNYAESLQLSPVHLPSDAPMGTWTWTATAYEALTVDGSFEVVGSVDLRTLLEKLDQLLEGQDDIASLIAYYGDKLQLGHEDLIVLIGSVAEELQMNQEELAVLVTEVFNKLGIQLEDMKAEIVKIEEKADGLYLVIGDLEVKLDYIEAKLVEVQGSIATIVTDIGTIKTDVSDINAKIVAIEGRLATIETDIGTIKVDVGVINGKLTDIEGRLATIETDVGTIKVDVASISAKLVYIQGDIATIDTEVGEIEVKAEQINATVTAIYGKIAVIESTVGVLEDLDVSAINATLQDIQGRTVTIQTTLGTVREDIGNVNGKIVALEGDVATIETDIGTIKTSLEDVNAKIEVNKNNIATIQTDIGTIKGRLTSIEDGIATIETGIGTIKTTTESIETTGESIKTDTGLQPATVGLSLIAAISAIAAAVIVLRKVYTK